MRGEARGTSQTLDDTIQTPARQELGIVPIRSTADTSNTSTGNASRRIIPGPTRERIDLRQTRFGEEPCVVCTSGTTGATGTQHDVYTA